MHILLLVVLVVSADDYQTRIGYTRLDAGERAQQIRKTLAFVEPADEQDIELTVLEARNRLDGGIAEFLDINAIGQDLVFARKVACDVGQHRRRYNRARIEPV